DSLTQSTIPYATVVLSNSATGKAERSTAADAEGGFEFTMDKTGSFVLKISSMGYNNGEIKVTVDGSTNTLNLKKLHLSESANELGSVEVIEQKKLITVSADKISYNTENDPDSNTATALEMLRRVPMVTVDGDDNIQVKGSSNFKVFLNGKPSGIVTNNPKDFLKSFPASNVKNIEVITSPGAKYDAEGIGGILNIVTHKKTLSGYSGSVRSGVDNYGSVNVGGNFATSVNKFTFSINVSGNKGFQPRSRSVSNRINYENLAFNKLESAGSNIAEYGSMWGSGEISYEIDTLNLISASFNMWGSNYSSENQSTYGAFDASGNMVQQYALEQFSESSSISPEVNIDYQKTFKRNKEEVLTFSYLIEFAPSSDYTNQSINNVANYFNAKNIVNANELQNEHTFQADYSLPIKKIGSVEMGLKDILRIHSSESNGTVYDFNTNTYITDLSRYVDFGYNQNIIGAYATFNGSAKKFSYKLGLRVENSQTYGTFKSSNGTDFENNSFEYVPSVSVSYQFSMKNSLQIAYNKRIQRPGIWYLNPYVDNLDPKNLRYGNPNLDPEHYHSFDANYNLFLKSGNINLTGSYSFSNNGIDRISWIQDGDVMHSTYKNILNKETYTFGANINQNLFKKLNLGINGSSNFSNMENNSDSKQQSSGWGFHSSLRLQYTILKTLKFSMYGGMYKMPDGLQTRMTPYYYSGLTLTQELLKKKLSISVRVNNVFWKEMSFRNEIVTPLFEQKSESFRPGRSYGLNISYRFGQMNTQVKKAKKGISNDDVKSGESNNNNG
ncbi:MAG TPA: hypothetical protein DCQ31_00800, partial [Bacteroidales bacterium]|nr:hypothetical protein [Bacteroidales bacterium]